MLTTFNFKDKEVASCLDIEELDYKIEKDNLAIYKSEEFLGYYSHLVGMPEEDFLEFVKKYLEQKG